MDLTTRAGRREQGRRILEAAEACQLSLEELAREIGCSRALLYQYVSGAVLAQSNRLQKIAQRTGYPLTYFYEAQSERAEPAEIEAGRSGARHAADVEPVEDLAPAAPADRTTTRPGPNNRLEPPAPTVAADSSAGHEVARVSLYYLEQLADLLEAHGDHRELLNTCEQILPYARQLGDRLAEARAWMRIGNSRVQAGLDDLARQALQMALSIAEEIGDTRLGLACRQSIGAAVLSSGDTEGAMREFKLVASGDDWTNRWKGTISQAAVHEHRGEYREALSCCEAALEIVEDTGESAASSLEAARSYILSNQANVYMACGDFGSAARLSQQLYLTSERCSQREQFVEALINLGICHLYQGHWGEADENLNRAIDLARFCGDSPRWGFARAWLALLLCSRGDAELAKDEAKDALQTGLECGSRRCEIQAQLSLGEAYLKSRAPREALYHFRHALRASSASSNPAQAALASARIAEARLELSDSSARADSERALQDAQRLGAEHVEAMAREQLARLDSANGDLTGAFEGASTAADIATRVGLPAIRWRAMALAAEVMDAQNLPDRAIEAGARAIADLDALRGSVRSRGGEESILEDPIAAAPYQAQLRRLGKSGRKAEAITLVDQAQWPPLSEFLSEDEG